MMRIEPLMEKAGAITSTVVLVMLLLSPPATAVNVVIDYSYDTNNFFGSGNPGGTAAGAQAKASLEEAANFLSDLMQDSFSPINTPPTFSSQVSNGEVYFEFTANFTHPGDGSTVTLNNEPFAADEYRIYAGGRSLGGNTLGIGGVGGQGLSVTNNGGGFSQDEFNQVTAITDLFVSQVSDRGETPGDFTRWGGSITFDNDSSPNWHYDHTTLPSTGENDFFSVALHELTHALGFGVSSEWNDLVSAGFFTGPTSTAVYGGSVPVTGGHWAENVSSTVFDGGSTTQETLMDPDILVGTRKFLTDLDIAAMEDIGWEPADTLISDVVGDYDSDGVVDADDYSIWRSTYGSTVDLRADGNDDGIVDAADYTVWRDNVNTSTAEPAGSPSIVPEPASLLLLSLGLLVVARRQR